MGAPLVGLATDVEVTTSVVRLVVPPGLCVECEERLKERLDCLKASLGTEGKLSIRIRKQAQSLMSLLKFRLGEPPPISLVVEFPMPKEAVDASTEEERDRAVMDFLARQLDVGYEQIG